MRGLLGAEGLYGVEGCGSFGGIDTKEEADSCRDGHNDYYKEWVDLEGKTYYLAYDVGY